MVKVPFRLPKSSRPTSASHIETEPPPFGFDDSPLFLCNRRDLFRLIEARDVYRIGADLLELAATDVEESRAEEAATAIAALAANRRAPTGGSSEQQSKPSPPRRCWCLAGRPNMEHLWSRAGANGGDPAQVRQRPKRPRQAESVASGRQ